MPRGDRSFTHDLTLRAVGLMVAGIGVLALRGLFHSVHLPPPHDPALVENGLAGLGYLCLSMGAALIVLGARLLDEVAVSERWARCDSHRARLRFPGGEDLSDAAPYPAPDPHAPPRAASPWCA